MSAANVKPAAVAVGSTAATILSSIPSAAEKNKQWQRELLMERIRSHSSQLKTFPELSKAMRMSMLEKRYALDAVEKSNLQKCLDSMQHCIKVTSRQGLVERLESLSRQLGLKFMEDTSGLFISTDMFFLEIILDASGALTDVKVHHECKIEQQSCSELVNCLNRGDFADFTVQLEGLSSIYQLNAEPKVKTKAFVALQAMETDLYNLFQVQNFTKDTQQLLKESAVGIVLKRRGGHPMKLTYFVSPYDLISLESKSMQPLSIDLITSKQIGMSVTVNLEASSANKLQILPTVSFAKDPQSGLDVPMYMPLAQMNSMLLPATFVLRLNKPLPVCYNTLRALGVTLPQVTADTGLESQHKQSPVVSTIMNLIVQTASEQQLKNSNKGLFVCLPDQTHCYFFSENKQLKASLVSSVPFTEPAQVPKILDFLKKQALFYTLLSSCVRAQSKMGNDMETTTILEVNATSFQQISVSLQHPYEESMATIEFDLRDGNVNCTIFSLNHNYDLLSLKLTGVVQKSLSIPVTIRALLKFWDQEPMKMFQRNIGPGSSGAGGGGGAAPQGGNSGGNFGNFSLVMGPNDSGGRSGNAGGGAGCSNAGGGMKMEPSARQQMPNVSAAAGSAGSNAGGVAGFLKFKGDAGQTEDFHESPKSQAHAPLLQSVESSSLGHGMQQQQQHDAQQTAKASDIEIADKYKNIWKDKTPNLKNCVSITPVSAEPKGVQQSMDVKRSGGIEIIPLTAQSVGANATSNVTAAGTAAAAIASPIPSPSTITITPINAGSSSSSREKKSSSSTGGSSSSSSSSSKRSLDAAGSSSDAQKEKKRKKKRDDSPMGPPEKVFSRQNSPAATSAEAATAVARKFSSPSSSPKNGSGASMLANTGSSSLTTRPSPKHSPVYSSPKHNTASNSPKSPFGTHSPKHGSSGKPSMSTLKSAAATSLSPKGDKSGSSNSGSNVGASNLSSVGGTSSTAAATALVRSLLSSGTMNTGGTGASSVAASALNAAAAAAAADVAKSREKQKLSMASSAASSAAVAAATTAAAAIKSSMGMAAIQQQLKSVAGLNHLNAAGNLGGGYGVGGGSSGLSNAMELNRALQKSVTAAVSLMTSTATMAAAAAAAATTTGAPQQQQLLQQQQLAHQQQQPPPLLQRQHQALGSSENTTNAGNTLLPSPSEYMVKSSQEGLKLTINKTTSNKSASSSKGKSGTSASSKKPHTGLKPGVNSGPASKKSTSTTGNSGGGSTTTTAASSKQQSTKHLFQKSNSSGNLNAKLSSSAAAAAAHSAAAGGGIAGLSKSNSFGDMPTSRKSQSKKSSAAGLSSAATCSSASQPATRLDAHVDMLKILQYASPTMAASMEGFMKGLNSKFQIPKLSQRNASAAATATSAAATTTMHTSSAPSTPTQLSPPATSNFAAAGNAKNTAVFNSAHFAANDAHQQQQQPQQKTAVNLQRRSPPPPYHAAIAAAAAAAAANSNVAMPAQQQQPSVSMHILKSPVPSPLVVGAGNFGGEQQHHNHHLTQQHHQQQQQQQQQNHVDYLGNSAVSGTMEESLVSARLTGK